MLDHLMAMLKCLEAGAEIDYDKMMAQLKLKRRSAQRGNVINYNQNLPGYLLKE
ncbi:hypothetical protein F5B21DRAFT_508197 [Xylaria acuta]|nr:hypothetical protein F5B21DRAFT_508197 [Xylaria acuta]